MEARSAKRQSGGGGGSGQRLASLDTFRGLSLCVMMFANFVCVLEERGWCAACDGMGWDGMGCDVM